MAGAYQHMLGVLRPTHFRVGRVLLFAGIGIGALVAAGLAYIHWQGGLPGKTPAQPVAEWIPPQRVSYTPEPPPKAPAPAPIDDPMAAQWAALQRQLATMQNDIVALKNRPLQAASAPPAPSKPQPKKHANMLYVNHAPKDARTAPTKTYTLAPAATKIACQIETVMNSDAGDTFTARTTTPVYDTATGRHLLVPQNSTILGKYEGGGLLYGNERLPTLSLSLTLPSGETVELGDSPVTNFAGTSGLVSSVNQHYGRLFGAVFIGGALRGGAMALQTGLAGLGPARQIGGAIAQSGAQVIQRQQGRAMDTRPTIEVHAGEGCQVILVKPLQLTAVGP